jgi:hydroxypyruvate isomerase
MTMLELSPVIEMLFREPPAHAFHERIERAAEAGFKAVEMWGWKDKDLAAISSTLGRTGVTLVSLVSEPVANIVDASTHAAFLEGVKESARVAVDLGCRNMVVLAGEHNPRAPLSLPRAVQRANAVRALSEAAPVAEDLGVVLVLENLNSRVDHVGHFLDRSDEALDIIDEVGSPALRMLYDLYHSVVMDEDPATVIGDRIDRVAHVQIADAPGRHEPGTGTVDWSRHMSWLASAGYRGHIGLEFVPIAPTTEAVGHIRNVLASLSPTAPPTTC